MARPRLHDDGYLRYLSTLPCCICSKEGETQACHVKIGHFGMQKKPDDRFCVPMCFRHHAEQHSQNEAKFWAARGLDPFEIAARLYAEYGGTGGVAKKKRERKPRPKRSVKIMSRGFDKTKTRKMNGRVEDRR